MFGLVFHSIDILTIISIIIFLIIGYRPPWFKKNDDKRKNNIPGPPSLPFLGTTWLFSIGRYNLNKIHTFYEDMYKKYGPLVKEESLFNFPVYSVFEKEDIENVLKIPSKYPLRPPIGALVMYRKSRPDRYNSSGIVNEQGEMWHFLRSNLTADLVSPKTMSVFSEEANVIGEEWSNLLKIKKDSNNAINSLENLVALLGVETICALVLGKRMELLRSNDPSTKSFELAKAIQDNFKALRDTQFGLPFWKYFKTPAYKLLQKSEETIYETVMEIITNGEGYSSEIYKSIIDAKVDEREKTAAMVDFIAAGIYTLKNSFVFLLYLVAKHPEVQEKILEDSSYSKYCVLESYRMLPTATPLARILEQDLEVGGHQLKTGDVVLCHNAIACRNEKYFKDADQFKPERWLDVEHKHNSTFLVVPFGTGRRICPGKRFIDLVLPIFLEHTVKNYVLSTEQDLELHFEYLRAPKGPIAIKFTDRD